MDKNYQNWLAEVAERINYLNKFKGQVFFNTIHTSAKPEDFIATMDTKRDNINDLDDEIVVFATKTMHEDDIEDILPTHNTIVFQYVGDIKVDHRHTAFIIDENSLVRFFNAYQFNLSSTRLESVNKAAHYCIDAYHEWLKRSFHYVY